ncbi:MAG: exo-alpha-sialidase [Nitrospinae bacterium]|nr:exo-alpha-sialidase [Nitrospinota bacterium]
MKRKMSVRGAAALVAALLFTSHPHPTPAAQSAAGEYIFAPEGGIAHASKNVSPPAVALDEKGTVYLAWIEDEKETASSVFVASSADEGKSFGPPVRVNGAGDAPSAIHASPSFALGRKGEVYVAWISPKPGADFAGDIRFARSLDAGKTFPPSVKVNDGTGPTSVGFESMTVGHDGKIYLAWLDGREKGKGTTGTYFAASTDGGRTFGKNVRIDANSCPCCRTAIATAPDGTIYAAWRKVFEGDVREIVITRSDDSGKSFSAPSIVGNDKWVIAGCPHRGPSLAVSPDGAVNITWYSEGDGLPKIFSGRAAEQGIIFAKAPIPVTPGFFPDHPALAMVDGRTVKTWEEVTPVFGNIMFTLAGGAARQLSVGPRKSGYPAIVGNAKGLVAVAWQKDEMRISKTLVRVGRFTAAESAK